MDFNPPSGYTLVFYFVDELPSTKKPRTLHWYQHQMDLKKYLSYKSSEWILTLQVGIL